jgi:hypothetical protein
MLSSSASGKLSLNAFRAGGIAAGVALIKAINGRADELVGAEVT